MPPALRGLGITFILTGLMAIGFMSFGGMLTGEDEGNKKEIVNQAIQLDDDEVDEDDENKVVNENTTALNR